MSFDIFGTFIRVLPRAHVSYWFGVFARQERPRWFARLCIFIYANLFKINFSELDRDLAEFKSLAQFFTRPLKAGVRPISSGFVSPVDGVLRDVGEVQSGKFIIAKGIPYSVEKLLGRPNFNEEFINGRFLNFYLSPRDYHHIHAPLEGEVRYSGHISGTLWPVNDWALKNVPNLFSINERHVVVINTKRGLVAVVMIAALNVGGISIDPSVKPGALIRTGQRLANFELGSAVTILLSKDFLRTGLVPDSLPRSIRYGELLGI
jgi:phosphatidylserine decarboxylase